MAIRTNHQIIDNTWFITFTCYDWIPLFEITGSYDLIYNWLILADEQYKIKTLAFVIMPNHVHLLLYFTDDTLKLNTIISNAKRFMAYAMVKRLTVHKQFSLLDKLNSACSDKEKNKGQKHKVFEPSFDAKVVYSTDFLYQKIDYIHHNPVQGKWNLADEFTGYEHSSAAFMNQNISILLLRSPTTGNAGSNFHVADLASVRRVLCERPCGDGKINCLRRF